MLFNFDKWIGRVIDNRSIIYNVVTINIPLIKFLKHFPFHE